MPLRDHFHSPLDDRRRWDSLHGGWPADSEASYEPTCRILKIH